MIFSFLLGTVLISSFLSLIGEVSTMLLVFALLAFHKCLDKRASERCGGVEDQLPLNSTLCEPFERVAISTVIQIEPYILPQVLV